MVQEHTVLVTSLLEINFESLLILVSRKCSVAVLFECLELILTYFSLFLAAGFYHKLSNSYQESEFKYQNLTQQN